LSVSSHFRLPSSPPVSRFYRGDNYSDAGGSFIDAYSRYVVHHKLLIELNGEAVATELQAALETTGAKPRVVHDHGSEFVNRDVAAVIKAHNLIDIKTRPRHPESNGIVERFNGTVRAESDDATATTTCAPRRSLGS
jgi:transposase InsO family protein